MIAPTIYPAGNAVTQEQTLIQTIQTYAPAQALNDDAYYDDATRHIYTTDLLVEGQHFSLDYYSPQDIGWKAAAVNLSDIAAMGGQPQYILVSIGLPETLANQDFINTLYQGIHDAITPFNAHIIGGDTVRATSLTLNITAIGVLPKNHTLGTRHQAKPGDWVITSGDSGLSTVGLRTLQKKWPGYLASKQAHCRPIPQIKAGLELSKSFTRYALMDSSDGLADAIIRLAQASTVDIALEAASLPLHEEVRQFSRETGASPLDLMLYGGEDFQLVATVPAGSSLSETWTVIGTVLPQQESEPQAALHNAAGETITLESCKTYQHFSESS